MTPAAVFRAQCRHGKQCRSLHSSLRHAAFVPIAALPQPSSSPAAQPRRHSVPQKPPSRHLLALQPHASAAPIDYAPSPTDAEVLRLPIKQELKPEQMVNVFGYPRDLRKR